MRNVNAHPRANYRVDNYYCITNANWYRRADVSKEFGSSSQLREVDFEEDGKNNIHRRVLNLMS